MDLRAGTETALALVVAVFGAAKPHCADLFANPMKVPVHDGVGIWLAPALKSRALLLARRAARFCSRGTGPCQIGQLYPVQLWRCRRLSRKTQAGRPGAAFTPACLNSVHSGSRLFFAKGANALYETVCRQAEGQGAASFT